MPVARYFFWVGSALIAMLLVVGWFWPNEPAAPARQASAETPVQQTIRIQSERKLPDRIVFDTSAPTIAPPPPPVVGAAPPVEAAVAAPAPLDARAELPTPAASPAAAPAPPPRRQARVHHRSPRQQYAPGPMWAGGYQGGGYQTAPRWSWNW